jgi:hypothetical protein
MTKQKVGLVLFWIGVIWTVLWGVIGTISINTPLNTLTMDELNQTIWATTGPLMMLWGLSAPLGVLIAGIGILIYSGARGSTVWKFGIGILLAFFIALSMQLMGHFPVLFGIGGALILLFFIGILWLWAKERMALKDSSTTAADFKLVGYLFMLIATWFVCAIAPLPFMKAYEGYTPTSPIHIMIFFVLGWLFLFLSHYKSRKQ